MAESEVITHEKVNSAAWGRICGNEPSKNGVYPCNEKGNEVAPVAGWSGGYVCFIVGRSLIPIHFALLGLTRSRSFCLRLDPRKRYRDDRGQHDGFKDDATNLIMSCHLRSPVHLRGHAADSFLRCLFVS